MQGTLIPGACENWLECVNQSLHSPLTPRTASLPLWKPSPISPPTFSLVTGKRMCFLQTSECPVLSLHIQIKAFIHLLFPSHEYPSTWFLPSLKTALMEHYDREFSIWQVKKKKKKLVTVPMAMLLTHKHVCHLSCGKVLRNRKFSCNYDTPSPLLQASHAAFIWFRATISSTEKTYWRPVALSNSHPAFQKQRAWREQVTATLRLMAYAVCPWISTQTLFVHPDTQANHQ